MILNSKFLIQAPYYCGEEFNYTLDVVFNEFLGLPWERIKDNSDQIQITLEGSNKTLSINADFFYRSYKNWLSVTSLPDLPLQTWNLKYVDLDVNLIDPIIPVIYGNPGLMRQDGNIYLNLDIFGSIFFMISRYEEPVIKERDAHNRFPATSSVAYKSGFLNRPIVDEYVEILWACMKLLWPGIQRKQYSYRVFLSHDVDHPFVVYDQSWHQIFRNIAGDLTIRKDLSLALQRIKCKVRNDSTLDPANTFDFIMDLSEKYDLKSEFYFMTDHTAGSLDGSEYSIESLQITKLMHRIYERGHRIGLHGSYNSFSNPQQIKKEFERLMKTTEKLGIKQDSWGGRQHYLRFENPITWQSWEDAGLNYDSTLGFADYIGFRCGTCHEFPVFDLETKRVLHLREIPLIVMDVILWGDQYPNLKSEKDIIERIKNISDTCRNYSGTFTLLWHNSSLISLWQKELYSEILKILK